MPVREISSEDFFRTKEHTFQFLETAQKHGADGMDAVVGALAGIRQFIESGQVDDAAGELHRLAAIFTKSEDSIAAALDTAHEPRTGELDGTAYDRLVFDKATEIAGMPDGVIIYTLSQYCASKGFPITNFLENIQNIVDRFSDESYSREEFRGHMVDEGVYEEIKEILRVVHDKDIYPEEGTTVDIDLDHLNLTSNGGVEVIIDAYDGQGNIADVIGQPLALRGEVSSDVPADAVGELLTNLMHVAKQHDLNPLDYTYHITFSQK